MSHHPCNMITGALGFVGLNLAQSLIMAGQMVVGVGRHDQNNPLPEKVGSFILEGPIKFLPGSVSYKGPAGSFIYVPCALEDPAPIAELINNLRPTVIYHLAAQSSAALSFKEPNDTFVSNVLGTLNLLEAVRALPDAERGIILSIGSCEEYGPQPENQGSLTENTPLNPISPYAVSKVGQTLLCRQYCRSYDLPILMTRSFSHSGPGQAPRFVFPSFARQIAAAEAGQGPQTIAVGDLSPIRDFLDVRDVVAAYRLLTKEGTPGEIYNVSSGNSLTIRDGLDILVSGARCPITVARDEARCRPSDVPFMVGDSSKLRRETGWTPEWTFADTLLEMLEAARKEIS